MISIKFRIIILLIFITTRTYSQQLDVSSEDINTKETYSAYYDKYEFESESYECSFVNKMVQNRVVFRKVESLEKTDFNGLKELLKDYAKFFTQSNPKFSWKREFRFGFEDVEFDFVTGETRVIAQAHSPLDGDIRIIINIDQWEKLKPLERVWLFFHEYAHEAYGLKHGEITLMYPLLPKDKLKEDWNLEDEEIFEDENRVLSRRREKEEWNLPFAPLKCGASSSEWFNDVSKANAYLYKAIDEFMGYISQVYIPMSNSTILYEQTQVYPTLKSNGKVAFPENKYIWVYPKGYKNFPDK